MVSSAGVGEPTGPPARSGGGTRSLGTALDVVGVVGAQAVVDDSTGRLALAGGDTHPDAGVEAAARAGTIDGSPS
jgi:hypothetical protein